MAQNLYALLVGINDYDPTSNVRPLQGCVNDAQAMEDYLKGRVKADGFALHPLMLTNAEATRDAIIQGFQQHLSKAGNGDIALFYYAGHGAQAEAPEVFWMSDPDRLLETLVCYDSRTPGQWDLADKELAKLIADLAAKQPHISVILDCCHSGSGTREGDGGEILTRRADLDKRPRPAHSFIFDPSEYLEYSNTRSVDRPPVGIQLPKGRHVLLSACRDIEEAKEYSSAGKPRGAFSYFLLESLQQANGSLTYRDLFKRTNALVRSRVSAQSPQMEATEIEDLEQPFLGGAIAPSPPYFTVSHDATHGWNIDGGAVHGLKPPSAGETTRLALFPFDSAIAAMKQLSDAIAEVEITEVLPQLSKVQFISGEAVADSQDQTFRAVVTQLPLPSLTVVLDEVHLSAAEREALRGAIATASPSGQPSLYLRELIQEPGTDSASGITGDFQISSHGGTYWLGRGSDAAATGRIPAATQLMYTATSPREAIAKLEHMARWTTVAGLASPANSRIQGAVEMKIYTGEGAKETAAEIKDAQIRLEYSYDDSTRKWREPSFRVKLKNTSPETLFCALFDLTERYRVKSVLPGNGIVCLEPGQEAWLADGLSLKGNVPTPLWQQGITEYRDILKVVACTAEFDPTLMNQGDLGQPLPSPTRSASGGSGSLNRLMKRVITRDIGWGSEEEEVYDDWVTNQITFTFVRPLESTPVNAAQAIGLGAGVTLQPHGALKANARLTTLPQSTRAVGHHVLPPLLVQETQPFQFTSTRGSDPGLSALELNAVDNPEAVTRETPLVVEAEIPLTAGEYILPVAYDGEFYLPLGYGKAREGKTKIVIERLTDPLQDGAVSTRSIQGSIRIFFQKVVTKTLGEKLSQQLGIRFEYPFLAIADLPCRSASAPQPDPKPEFLYIRDLEEVKRRVAEATNIALYIHGIFGDTESMVPSLLNAKLNAKLNAEVEASDPHPTSQPIRQFYDLVLAFDYENLNTSIEDNARALGQRLAAVGLGPNHGKTLHVIAHSMGGLVSRWLIEQEGGDRIVNHLIMLGTPNNGSPWPTVQAGLTLALTFAMNGLSSGFLPLKIFAGLLQNVEAVDVSLDQMQPGSDFLAQMAAAKDPGIPYSIVVGNTALIEADPGADLKEKIKRKLGQLVEIPFFAQPNDIAVSVESIEAIPAGRSPAPKLIPAACNHLVYFTDPAGLDALSQAVVGTGIQSPTSAAPR